jgi:cytochrome c
MAQNAGLTALLLLAPLAARAQIPLPQAEPPNAATLFRSQCATCHSLDPADPPRQGPHLAHVVGRKIGGVEGYKYTPGYREADAVWDEARLDTYLTNPQAMFPGSTMAYRQANANTRRVIITYLKDQS